MAGYLSLVSGIGLLRFGVNLFSHLTLSQSSSLPTRTPTSYFLLQLIIGFQIFIERWYSIPFSRDSRYIARQLPLAPREGTTGMSSLGWTFYVNIGDLNRSPYTWTVSTPTPWSRFSSLLLFAALRAFVVLPQGLVKMNLPHAQTFSVVFNYLQEDWSQINVN